ncbi:DEAD/DEAH box helicase, partial [Campylobacter jejuni]|nr:DEAD/DEAH box helicase [Campylobacter jejuni]
KTKLLAIASEIVIMAAKRSLVQAKKITVDLYRQTDFIASAGLIYTSDQDNACHEILQDFQSVKVMDRLLSGDVGVGKPEVALNAIYQ